MSSRQVFEQTIQIDANAITVERCIIDLDLMHRWLNPALKCEPIGKWTTDVGSKSRFIIKIPFIQPTLYSQVIKREPGLIAWEFEGFFHGCDRWECQPNSEGTFLINRFEFEISNAIVSWGFNQFAANWTRNDMQFQLRRLKRVAEEIYLIENG